MGVVYRGAVLSPHDPGIGEDSSGVNPETGRVSVRHAPSSRAGMAPPVDICSP